jgi:hypothetical protein
MSICGRRVRCCLFLAWVSFLLGVSAWCEAIDGFVTRISGPTQFEVGDIRVIAGQQTSCAVETVDERIMFEKEGHWYNLRLRIASQHPIAESIVAKACDDLKLAVGTPASLRGERGGDGAFRATRIVALRMVDGDIKIPGSRAFRYLDTNSKHWTGELQGGAIVEEDPSVIQGSRGWAGQLWLDGYPMAINSNTIMSTAALGTEITYDYPAFRRPRFRVRISPEVSELAHPPFRSELFQPNACAIYRSKIGPDGRLSILRLKIWPNKTDAEERKFLKRFQNASKLTVQEPNYKTHTAGTIESGHRYIGSVEIVPSHEVQSWVETLGQELVPAYQKSLPDSDPGKVNFRFYVVQGSASISLLRNALFVSGGLLRGLARSALSDTVQAMPDGLIVVSDASLARLQNRAQLAAILSYAITTVLQKHTYMTNHALQAGDPNVGNPHLALLVIQDEQTIRIGIRQMFLAGYDIREASYAWAVAEGRTASNPTSSFDDVPWYAHYAFTYMSQYYSDVDYSKLKRGEKEYAQFRDELREADPEAFEQRK